MYDASDPASFVAAEKMHDKIADALDADGYDMPPCAVLASKADLEDASLLAAANRFSSRHGYPPPVSVSFATQVGHNRVYSSY
mmetsp:Transcript_6659/g.11587  ORF Transcript_6659/g.11587 Transcript_6659/m.11587 type:complete len:83 (-) Transcript_6659:131-379(-)